MSYGLIARNNSDSVIISSDQYGLAFIGNATFTNTTKPLSYATQGTAISTATQVDPFYIYTISSVYPPLVFLQLKNASLKVSSVNNIGGNNWEIVVGGQIAGFSTPPIVKCFAQLDGYGTTSVYGFRVRDQAGLRTWDSTEPMLIIKAKLDFAQQAGSGGLTQEQAFSGISQPYISSFTDCAQTGLSYTTGPGSVNTLRYHTSGWYMSGSNVGRRSRGFVPFTYTDDTFPDSDLLPADRVYLIEGANY